MELNYIRLPHSIYAKDEDGRILAKIEFPEVRNGVPVREKTGEYDLANTYVAEDSRHSQIGGELVRMALDEIRRAGGRVVQADCPFARKYLHEQGIADL